ncbi:MAG: PilZ domain-containing protein [Vicinamibacteria bacterium]|jgi:DNA-binding response OmpR family regulator|nr:PilZ domain-containing protein [Vicinamibacteria bacterium]
MPVVLLCSTESWEGALAETLVYRNDVERRQAASLEAALAALAAGRVDIVLIDRDLPNAVRLVQRVRRDARNRNVSVAVIAPGDFDVVEMELLEAGANAVLRLPAGPEWDERLARLITVPVRREARFPVVFEVEAKTGVAIHSVMALAVNISSNGMLVETDFCLKVGDDIDLRFRLPSGGEVVAGCARVVRQAACNRFGVEFYGLEGEGCSQIERFVEQLANAGL